ncbi:hypothetical protein PHLGIDRAFT_183223 [Phlebiopsis gigantea 11061_1 CR5-6]|uniref:Rho termination factor N-terminal domain-containing protein n=1 Tax=Phlebiopsis gigantea (strain 11061_1 CR5-6) TaxID=745531 RepID=A0A0C3S3W5_PHLG1|nr:hypothetical protein PHLGIDRAFT_183223 [Phlebiopsis gigantea 11061_1 CR5-6]
MSTSQATAYTKLTVIQLKGLCKDRKITGYSKLSKPVLIQKLVDFDRPTSFTISAAYQETGIASNDTTLLRVSSVVNVLSKPTSPIDQDEPLSSAPPERSSDSSPMPVSGASGFCSDAPQATSSVSFHHPDIPIISNTEDSAFVLNAQDPIDFSSTPVDNSTPAKRVADTLGTSTAKRKNIEVTSTPISENPSIALKPSALRSLTTVENTPLSKYSCNSTPPQHWTKATSPKQPSVIAVSLSRPSKRFKPLVVGRQLDQPISNPDICVPISNAAVPAMVTPSVLLLTCFEFRTSQLNSQLKPISLPPPLSQRKRVQGWAVILSALDNQSRRACSLVSRTFRYAVYLSAVPILRQNFAGKRFDRDTNQYSLAMTNLWPYLRFREDEAKRNRRIYEESFLHRHAKDGKANVISSHLWGSPDNGKQLAIAVRFALSTLWFALSIGGRESEAWLQYTIISAQEVIQDEIWIVTIRSCGRSAATEVSTFYVLEQTCEVIGRPNSAAAGPLVLELRSDWSNYIQGHLTGVTTGIVSCPSLLQNLKWAHYEEYDRGVSKLWLRRVEKEGDLGTIKRTVAERYTLACVVANSVSGAWMSTAQMTHEFAGLPDRSVPSARKSGYHSFPVNLYLPATHHVESVHFHTSSGAPLHPALAVIQTPSREYYVLRENGMQVGSEEEGVAPLWMEVIGCDSQGLAI